jgi:hypothetical protein
MHRPDGSIQIVRAAGQNIGHLSINARPKITKGSSPSSAFRAQHDCARACQDRAEWMSMTVQEDGTAQTQHLPLLHSEWTKLVIAAQQKQSPYRYYTAWIKHLGLLHSIDKALTIAAQHQYSSYSCCTAWTKHQ